MPIDQVSPNTTPTPSPNGSPGSASRPSGAFNFNPTHWNPSFENEVERRAEFESFTHSVQSRIDGLSAPRMRSLSPMPPSPPVSQRPTIRSSPASFALAQSPSQIPPAPLDDLPTSLAYEAEALSKLVDQSNAFVAALTVRVASLHQTTAALRGSATFEQLSALVNSRPEFKGLDVGRCVGLQLPTSTWKTLMRSILDENAARMANTVLDEQAPGTDLLAGVLHWRARQESEELGHIRINQRRASSIAADPITRRGSVCTSVPSRTARSSSIAFEATITRRSSGLALEQHLPSMKE